MFKIFYLLTFLVSASVMACPDFTGHYVSSNSMNEMFIDQDSCSEIIYTLEDGEHHFKLDGKMRLVGKMDMEDAEGKVYESLKIYQSKKFSNGSLITKGKAVTTYVDGKKPEINQTWSEAIQDDKKNLTLTTHFQDETTESDTLVYLGQ